ncbi:MAG: lipopolysaccharide biosynthesis protein [Treponema sp.]|uniref:GNVR domain-containing protein n=1 Tax=Treponema sp. TaxID=166 RepID=UPI00298D8A56|nr:GNVR domain-containing protein [Treponema sp.]MCQ2601933.1 lipopolysaccharide biosynthesis protein [Treponema sp.]
METEVKNESIVQNEDEEISLIDLLAVLLRYKWLIILTTFGAALFAVVFSILSLKLPPEKSPLPNQFCPKATMLIMDDSSGSSSLSSMISASGLGSLAGLAGVSGGSSNSALATYLIKSDSFLDMVTDRFGLIEKWEIEKSPRANSRKALKEVLGANYDKDTGVFTVSFTDINPAFACEVVDFCVEKLESKFLELGLDKNILEKKNLEENIELTRKKIVDLQNEIKDLEYKVSNVYSAQNMEAISLQTNLLKLELEAQQSIYKQLKTQLELTKINLASEKPVFQILEKASVPDMKAKPSRGKLCIIITFAGFFISVFMAFLLNAVKNIKNDEEAMAKLKPAKKSK